MININTLVSAYHFGNKIATTSFGSSLHQRYIDIKSQLSPKAWSLYQDAIQTCSFQHYYSFGHAFKKIEAIFSENDGFYQKCFFELQNCGEVHSLIEGANQLGRDLENSLLQMLTRLPSKDISVTFNTLDLYRSWMNVFYQLHSTKLITYLHQHKAIIENKHGYVQQFLESKEVYPLSRHNRILIRKLAIKGTDKDILYLLECFDGLRNSVIQVIFETHFNRSFKLNKNQIVNYREKELNKVRVFSTKVFGTEVFRYQGNFILLFENNTLQDIGFIKRRVGRNLEMGDKSISTIDGLLYPKTDYNLFVPDPPN